MAVLSWGGPKVEFAPFESDGTFPSSPVWTAFPELKEGSSQLETADGDTLEAKDEFGNTVDYKTKKSSYTFTTQVYMKKGDTKPIEDEDGVVILNYALRLTPEDENCLGFMLPKCSVSVKETWTSADGGLWEYTFKALKPDSGTMLQRYPTSS